MGHRHCQLTLKEFVEGTAHLDTPLWYVRHGLADEAWRWAADATNNDNENGTFLTSLRTFIDTTHYFAMGFERPLEATSGPGINLIFTEIKVEGNRIRWGIETAHLCDGMFTPIPLSEYGQDVAMAQAEMVRRFALEPIASRPRVDIDVAEPKRGGRRAKNIPTTIVVRWRKQERPEPVPHNLFPTWSHRWIVRAHLRELADGRVVPVREHVKGPEGLPLVLKRKIDAVVR